MSRIYLKINSKGKLYQSSKEPRDGFEKIELKEGKVTYHKYFSNVKGKLTYLALRESPYNRKDLIINIKGDSDYSIQIPVFHKDNLTSWFRSIARFIENVVENLDREYSVGAGVKTSEDGKRTYRNIYFNYSEGDENPLVQWRYQHDELPKVEWEKETTVDGEEKDVPNFKAQDTFLYKAVENAIETMVGEKTSSQPATEPSTTTSTEPETSAEIEEDNPEDDLPF